jgi:hypothetical protein
LPVKPSLGRRVRSFLPPRQTSEDFTFELAIALGRKMFTIEPSFVLSPAPAPAP